MKRFHHYHVVYTGPGCVLPDSMEAHATQHEAHIAVFAERDVQRDMLAVGERIITDRDKLGFSVESDTVGRYRYFVYTEGCNDPDCEVLAGGCFDC